MKKSILFGATIFLFCIVGTGSAAQYLLRATLYSGLSGSGSFVTVPRSNASVPKLATLGFDNRARSVCLVGTWLFYDGENFNAERDSAMEYIFEPGFTCVNFQSLGGFVSSVRPVGQSGDDYRMDTVTLYASTYFQGLAESLRSDTPHLRIYGTVKSFVVTGSSDWTIYNEPNFEGEGICLKVSPTAEYAPHFVPDTTALSPKVSHGSIASVRRGCYTDRILSIKPEQSATTTAATRAEGNEVSPVHFVIPFFSSKKS